jgi:hypothetical protein
MEHEPTPIRPAIARTARPRRVLAAGVSALALASFLVACGSDGDDEATSTTEPSSETTAGDPAPAEETTDRPALCDAWVVIDKVGSALGDPDAPPEVAEEATQGIFDALDGVEAPEGLDAQLQTANEAVSAALGGDPSAFESPEFTAAVTDLGAWVHGECGFQQVEVISSDHAFEGFDGPLDAGVVSFHNVNEGADAHVVVLHRFDDESGLSADDLVAAGEDPASTVLEDNTVPVVSGAFAAPGGEGYLTADLEPGRYLVFCPIPVGFTGEGPPAADAPPHLALGMYAEFTVA